MRGIKSHGMLLAASNEEHTAVRARARRARPPRSLPAGAGLPAPAQCCEAHAGRRQAAGCRKHPPPARQVEPLSPPPGAAPGERCFFGADSEQPPPAEPNQVAKKKLWEAAAPGLGTDGGGVANFRGRPMNTSAGPVRAASLAGARIG